MWFCVESIRSFEVDVFTFKLDLKLLPYLMPIRELTISMACGTCKFNAKFTRALQ